MHPKRYFLWMHTKNRRKNTVLPKNFSRQYCLWHLCQYQHTKPICSYWQGTIFSSWNHQWLWLVTHSGLAPSSLGPLRGVSLSQNSRNHGITTIPILHGCYRSRHLTSGGRSKMKTLLIPSILSLPILAHLRHGAMRNCSSCPMKSSYSVVRIQTFCGHI